MLSCGRESKPNGKPFQSQPNIYMFHLAHKEQKPVQLQYCPHLLSRQYQITLTTFNCSEQIPKCQVCQVMFLKHPKTTHKRNKSWKETERLTNQRAIPSKMKHPPDSEPVSKGIYTCLGPFRWCFLGGDQVVNVRPGMTFYDPRAVETP